MLDSVVVTNSHEGMGKGVTLEVECTDRVPLFGVLDSVDVEPWCVVNVTVLSDERGSSSDGDVWGVSEGISVADDVLVTILEFDVECGSVLVVGLDGVTNPVLVRVATVIEVDMVTVVVSPYSEEMVGVLSILPDGDVETVPECVYVGEGPGDLETPSVFVVVGLTGGVRVDGGVNVG